jgi:hypothetical protein
LLDLEKRGDQVEAVSIEVVEVADFEMIEEAINSQKN